MKNRLAMVHKVLAMYIAVGVFVQMFLAGVWHSGVVDTPDAHVFFGLSMLLAALLALIAAVVAKLPKAVIKRTGFLFFLILLQPFLMEARRNGLPIVSALHALNAPIIGIVAGTVFEMARHVPAEESHDMAPSPATGD